MCVCVCVVCACACVTSVGVCVCVTTHLGCSSLSWMSGRRGGIISEPISLQIMINAVETSNIIELFRSYRYNHIILTQYTSTYMDMNMYICNYICNYICIIESTLDTIKDTEQIVLAPFL